MNAAKPTFLTQNPKIRSNLIRWLTNKRLGESEKSRNMFVDNLDFIILSAEQTTKTYVENRKSKKSDFKNRLDNFITQSAKFRKTIESLKRSPQSTTELSIAIAEQRDSRWTVRDFLQLEETLERLEYDLTVLNAAARSVKKRHSSMRGIRQFQYQNVSVIAAIWKAYLGRKPSPSDKGVFKQFLEFLNDELHGKGFARLPTNSRGLKKAMESY